MQPIVVPPSLLVTAVYLRGGYRERLAAARGVVQDVLPIFLRVDWVGAVSGVVACSTRLAFDHLLLCFFVLLVKWIIDDIVFFHFFFTFL